MGVLKFPAIVAALSICLLAGCGSGSNSTIPQTQPNTPIARIPNFQAVGSLPGWRPMPADCTPDSYGYCIASQSLQTYVTRCTSYGGSTLYERLGTNTYNIYSSSLGAVKTYTEALQDDPNANCMSVSIWNPANPSVELGDPNLP